MPTPRRSRGARYERASDTAWQSLITTQSARRMGPVSMNEPFLAPGRPGRIARRGTTCSQVETDCCDRGLEHLPSILDDSRCADYACRRAAKGLRSGCAPVRDHRRQTALAGDSSRLRQLAADTPRRECSSPTSRPKGGNTSVSTALHDPTAERDACGIGLVADSRTPRLARAARPRARRARRRLPPRRVGCGRRHRATVRACSFRCTRR